MAPSINFSNIYRKIQSKKKRQYSQQYQKVIFTNNTLKQ